MVTVTLKWPVTFEGREVTELTMRPCRVDDQIAALAAKGIDAEKEKLLLATLCNVPQELIGQLVMGDYKRLQQALETFLL